jgi:hypothetical protein
MKSVQWAMIASAKSREPGSDMITFAASGDLVAIESSNAPTDGTPHPAAPPARRRLQGSSHCQWPRSIPRSR